MKVAGRDIQISNPDKVLFPDDGITKASVIKYYRDVSKYMLKHIKSRPVVMRRWPDGIYEDGFYQKDRPEYFPDWINSVDVPLKKGGSQSLVVLESEADVAYLANQGVISFHAWLSSKSNLKKPDRIVFDLDPSNEDFSRVKHTARLLRDILDKQGYHPLVMLTGSRGVHIVAPISPETSFDHIKEAADSIAQSAAQKDVDRLTTEIRKDKRGSRVFIDTARNAYGQTGIAPYSLRGLPGAPVAVPLRWQELDQKDVTPRKYKINTILKRLSNVGDIWEDI